MPSFEKPGAAGGMASPALYCGLAAICCAVGVGVWQLMDMLQPVVEAMPDPGSAMMLSVVYLVLNISALCLAVIAIVFGAMASGEARRAGRRPPARGRMGFYLGIVALVLLLVIFVASFISVLIEVQGEPVFKRERPFALLTSAILGAGGLT